MQLLADVKKFTIAMRVSALNKDRLFLVPLVFLTFEFYISWLYFLYLSVVRGCQMMSMIFFLIAASSSCVYECSWWAIFLWD